MKPQMDVAQLEGRMAANERDKLLWSEPIGWGDKRVEFEINVVSLIPND